MSARKPSGKRRSRLPKDYQAGRLNLRIMDWSDAEADDYRFVLIEGDRKALENFGRLMLDHAAGKHGCDLWAHLRGPGNLTFTRTSDLGFYLHLLPCDVPTKLGERFGGRRA